MCINITKLCSFLVPHAVKQLPTDSRIACLSCVPSPYVSLDVLFVHPERCNNDHDTLTVNSLPKFSQPAFGLVQSVSKFKQYQVIVGDFVRYPCELKKVIISNKSLNLSLAIPVEMWLWWGLLLPRQEEWLFCSHHSSPPLIAGWTERQPQI